MRNSYRPAPYGVGHTQTQPSFLGQCAMRISNAMGAALDKVFFGVIQDKVPDKGQRKAEKDEGMLSTCISCCKKYAIVAGVATGVACLWHAYFPGCCPEVLAKTAQELENHAQSFMELAKNFGPEVGSEWRKVAVAAQELSKSIKVALGLA